MNKKAKGKEENKAVITKLVTKYQNNLFFS